MTSAATPLVRPRPAAVLIDLDGTLVDSVPDLAAAANRMLAELGRDPLPESTLRRFVGNGVTRLVERSLAGDFDGRCEPDELERAQPLFMAHYAAHLSDLSRSYPGVPEGLERLAAAGVPLGCVTNKPEGFSRRLLEDLGLLRFFGVVIGGDTLAEKKPHPAPLRHAAAGLGIELSRCVLIGDSASDIKAARAAGCVCVCVRYGYNQGMDLAELEPDFLADDFTTGLDYLLGEQ